MDEWRKIDGFPNYEINRDGFVMNTKTGRILKPRIDRYGYLYVDLCYNGDTKSKTIHRLVGIAFIPNPLGKSSIDHINGDKMNNLIKNLRWATMREQLQNKPSKGYRKIKGAKTNPWCVRIRNSEGKYIHIGYFPTEELAQQAVREARIKHHGEFANLTPFDEEVQHPAD